MANCELCGEPMAPGEEMFKYHGLNGPCPKPPIPKPKVAAVVEYLHRETDGQFWLDIHMDRQPYSQLGPFDTAAERQRAHDDMLGMMRQLGAKDLPNHPQ